ncbi:MAG: hypothetical protein WC570_05445 [Patescibacteria group bacterium]
MNLDRLEKNFDYASRVGFSRAYLWGVEWWYWMKETNNDPSFWEAVKTKLSN